MSAPSRVLLVVGATGQLGGEVISNALQSGYRVRALVRRTSKHAHLKRMNVEIVYGDLRNSASLDAACDGVLYVVATANAVAPTVKSSFQEDEVVGYRNLIRACQTKGVQQFVLISLASMAAQHAHRYISKVPIMRSKFEIEQMLMQSGLEYSIFRASLFMDDYFSLMGSNIPLFGEESATLNRLTGYKGVIINTFGHLVEKFGIAIVPGNKANRYNFIAVKDVAELLVDSIGQDSCINKMLIVGGPQEQSWEDVGRIYGKLLKKKIRVIAIPTWLPRYLRFAFQPFSEFWFNYLGMLWILSEVEIPRYASCYEPETPRSQMTSEQYLSGKYKLKYQEQKYSVEGVR